MLSALEAKMEAEVKEIENKYKEMRKPLLTLLAEKQEKAATPAVTPAPALKQSGTVVKAASSPALTRKK